MIRKVSQSRRKLYRITVFLSSLFFFFCQFPCGSIASEKVYLHHDLLSVCFADDREGWACGRWGTMLYTEDGGLNWIRQQTGTDFTLNCVIFADSKCGWAVGDGGTIIHTVDGGKNWLQQESPVPFYLMGAHFADTQTGWIVTERTHILYTNNGGKDWVIQFHDTDYILKSVSFCDDSNGWAVGEYGFIYRTSNGGLTWEHQAGKFEYDYLKDVINAGNFLFDVVAVDPLTAWVAGIDGYLAKTEDGGVSWNTVSGGIPKRHLFGIAMDGQGNIILSGDKLLLAGGDEGRAFIVPEIQPSVRYGWLYGVSRRGEMGFAAVGRQGWIYLSDSKGISWHKTRGK